MKESPELVAERQRIVSRLVEARMASGVSQQELANRIGTQKPNISRIESGACIPTLTTLKELAKGLGKTLRIEMI